MRTKNKDILMICKLWYVKEWYDISGCSNQVSALKDYLKNYTMCPEISDESLLRHLTGAVEEFVDKHRLLLSISSGLNFLDYEEPRDFLIRQYIYLLLDTDCNEIDLSDYVKIQRYVIDSRRKQNKEDIYLPWWELNKFKEKE